MSPWQTIALWLDAPVEPDPAPQCPSCEGSGEVQVIVAGPDADGNYDVAYRDCQCCAVER